MKLYVCWGTFPTPLLPGGHPCRDAYLSLKRAGHDPDVERVYGAAMLPDFPFNITPGRLRVKRWTGSSEVPVLQTDEGDVIQGSHNIVEWAERNVR
jgi:hypothetical protein